MAKKKKKPERIVFFVCAFFPLVQASLADLDKSACILELYQLRFSQVKTVLRLFIL